MSTNAIVMMIIVLTFFFGGFGALIYRLKKVSDEANR